MERTKRSFEFRMSKKVAELTQVVHMLFTRNHEKEVEIEALKDAYELEIRNVIQDAQSRLESAHAAVKDLKQNSEFEKDKTKDLLQEEYRKREEELNRKLSETETLLQNERQECQNIRDLLINAQKDIEQLRQGVSEQLALKSEEILKRNRDIDRLRKQISLMEKAMKTSEKETNTVVKDFEKSNEKLESELTHVHELLEEGHMIKEQLLVKNKTLESELKLLKKDFNRRLSDAVSRQHSKAPQSVPVYTNHSEELERLRQEIQRYRLELSNRDSNFNRVFAAQRPVIVDPRASKAENSHSPQPGKPQIGQPGLVLQNGFGHQVVVNGFTKGGGPRKVRSPAVPKVPKGKPNLRSIIQSYYEEFNTDSRPNSACSQLPSISSVPSSATGSSSRSQKFSKPKPLPKELLYTK